MYGFEGCQAVLYPETRYEQATLCLDEVEEGTEFCEKHRGCDE